MRRRFWILALTAVLLASGSLWVFGAPNDRSTAGLAELDPAAFEINLVDYPTLPLVGTEIATAEDAWSQVLKISDDLVVLTVESGDEEGNDEIFTLMAVDRATGKTIWSVDGEALGAKREYGWEISCESAPSGNEVVCLGLESVDEDSEGGLITRIDLRSGDVLAQAKTASIQDVWFQFLDQDLLVSRYADVQKDSTGDADPESESESDYNVSAELRRISLAGDEKWSITATFTEDYYGVDAVTRIGPYLAIEVAAVESDDEWATATLLVDAATGATVKQFESDMYSPDGIAAFQPADPQEWSGIVRSTIDGAEMWRHEDVFLRWSESAYRHGIVLGAEGEYKYLEDGKPDPANDVVLVAFDSENGERLWDHPIASSGWGVRTAGGWLQVDETFVDIETGESVASSYGRLVGSSPTMVYTAGGDSIRALNRADLSVAWKLDLAQFDPDAEYSPYPQVIDQHIYFEVDGRVVVLDPALGSGEV